MKISDNIRLRPFQSSDISVAVKWYEDRDIQWMVNGTVNPYSEEQVLKMFTYQQHHGELFMIEYFENNEWTLIGDVALMEGTSDDLPICIGNRQYWGKGIAYNVLTRLIDYAFENGRSELKVTIYYYNTRSINLYEKCGFKQVDSYYILKAKNRDK